MAEMTAIANRIQLLIHGSHTWRPAYRYAEGFSPVQEQNAYRYSDILILLRRTTHQSVLEQALRHANVPYTLGGKGRGLFTRQETRDVSLFLNVLTNPTDAYSLIGFLRSPWIGLSDETLAELAWSEEGFSTENLFKNYGQETDIIDRYRELLGTRLASELVRSLIDETGFDALLAGLPRGTQRLANLRKVLDWLRENERGAQTTPATVARKLAKLIADPPNVPEATLLDPAQNAVTIMTVHGSKGLTKRVVVIPDISSKAKNDTAFCRVFHDPSGQPCLGINIDSPDKNAVKSPGFKAENDRAKSVREQEQNNLLYVAMTRARDLVITSASPGKKAAGWLTQLEPLIGTDIPAIPYSILAEAAEPPQSSRGTQPTVDGLTMAIERLMPPPEQPLLQRMPATKLAKERESRPEQTSTQSSVKNATELGSLGHAVLEHLAHDEWQGSVVAWIERLREDFNLEKTEASTLQQRIEQTREVMTSLMSNMIDVRPEFPFVIHENHSLIDGTIDLLCRSKDTLYLFDYKFTEADDVSVLLAYSEQMKIYQQAGRYVFSSLEKTETQLVVISTKGVRLLPVVI
jgi:ATP-dependent exoDNAse (exonuclease V) beta subunit